MEKIKKPVKVTIILFLSVIMVLSMIGCAKKYQVDYDGEKELWSGAKDSYRAGSTVTIYYTLIISDADLTFRIDGEKVSALWKEGKGYRLRFVMPEHDVKITTEVVESMMYMEE